MSTNIPHWIPTIRGIMNTQKDIKLFLKTVWLTTVLPDRWHCWTSCSDSQISPCIQVALAVRHCKNKEVCMHMLYTYMWEMTSCERNMAGTSWFIAVQSLARSLDSMKLPVKLISPGSSNGISRRQNLWSNHNWSSAQLQNNQWEDGPGGHGNTWKLAFNFQPSSIVTSMCSCVILE